MESLLSARLLMALSLSFHIIFALVGMIMPFMMSISHWKWLKTRDDEYYKLTRWWMKGFGIFFATGAVSGTTLSFELGLLWPTFMEHAGPIFGMPFSWEGTAFFLEAIFLGLYLYGFKRMHPWAHWLSGVGIGVTGVASGLFVIAANSWMNSPQGFDWVNGVAMNIDPVKAMFNDAWLSQAQHTLVTATLAVSMAVLGIHSGFLYFGHKSSINRKAISIAAPLFVVSALLAPISGDLAAKDVARRQPVKLAAMESHFETEKRAGLWLGGIPNVEEQKVEYGIKIPGALSFLAGGNINYEVKGLNDYPRENWPPVLIVHIAFQVMVAIGSFAALIGLIILFSKWRKFDLTSKHQFLLFMMLITPLGFIAIEAGWIVTEVGRQPWIIYEILKTADSVSPMPGLHYSLFLFLGLYSFLVFMVGWLMFRQFKQFNLTDGKNV